MIPALDVAADLNLTSNGLQKVESASLRMSNSVYLTVFDRADESILSDYEALLTAVDQDQLLAQSMFENIVRGMILAEPNNCVPSNCRRHGTRYLRQIDSSRRRESPLTKNNARFRLRCKRRIADTSLSKAHQVLVRAIQSPPSLRCNSQRQKHLYSLRQTRGLGCCGGQAS